MARTAIILPVHNRREITLRCLAGLEATGVLAWAQAVVVDDGSTDGTGDAVRAQFPAARVLPGSGDLWWGGAIRQGMEDALREGADFFVWLNDDCQPEPGTLRLLVDHAARTGGMASGWARTPSGDRYVAYRKTHQGLRPVDVPAPGGSTPCDAAAGNCVVFARQVVEAVGLPDAASLPHSLLDVDYTLSATRRGFGLDLLGSAVCHNDDNLGAATASWLLDDASPWRQWKIFLGRRSTYAYGPSFHLHYKHWGGWGLWLFARGYLRLAAVCVLRTFVPVRWLRTVYATRSATWQRQQFYRQAKVSAAPKK